MKNLLFTILFFSSTISFCSENDKDISKSDQSKYHCLTSNIKEFERGKELCAKLPMVFVEGCLTGQLLSLLGKNIKCYTKSE